MSNFRHRLSKLSPEKQRYALETLPSHLVGRAQPQRLHQLLSDFDFIESKIAALGVPALIEDYELAITADILPSSPCLQTWQSIAGALRLSAHILERDPAQLAGQLLGRLLSFDTPDLQTLLETAKQWRGKTWLRPLTANLTPPGGPLLRTLRGHNGLVTAVALSPDGQYALSGSDDNTVKVWDWRRGEELHTLRGHNGPVSAVALSPDGQYALSGSDDNTVKVWDWRRGEELHTLRGHNGSVTAVALSPDGQFAVSGSDDNTVKVWDVLTGKPVVTFSGDSPFRGCAMAPDGVTMVAGDESGVVHFLRLEMDSCFPPVPRPSPGTDNPASLFYRGLSGAQQGRAEEAFACWHKAVNLRPDAGPRIWQQGGKALLWAGECYEEAARCFQNGVQLQPDNPELWNGLAIAQRRAGDAEAALSTYDRALELQPDAPYLWANRAYALLTLGFYPEAQANFHQALKLDPTYANAYYNLACLYALQGKVELALDHLRQAIGFNPKYRELAKTDTDLDGIRQDTRFRALIENRAIPGTD